VLLASEAVRLCLRGVAPAAASAADCCCCCCWCCAERMSVSADSLRRGVLAALLLLPCLRLLELLQPGQLQLLYTVYIHIRSLLVYITGAYGTMQCCVVCCNCSEHLIAQRYHSCICGAIWLLCARRALGSSIVPVVVGDKC
jgi:hypothetical protein